MFVLLVVVVLVGMAILLIAVMPDGSEDLLVVEVVEVLVGIVIALVGKGVKVLAGSVLVLVIRAVSAMLVLVATVLVLLSK